MLQIKVIEEDKIPLFDVKKLDQVKLLKDLLADSVEDSEAVCTNLFKTFGSFYAIINAPLTELVYIEGLGAKGATLLSSLKNVLKTYIDDINEPKEKIYNTESAYEVIKNKTKNLKEEGMGVMILNSKGFVVFNDIVSVGSMGVVPIHIRKIVNLCIVHGADTAIIYHNHPSGNPMPSKSDIRATKEIQLALECIYVTLYDHIIVADNDYCSLRKAGWLSTFTETLYKYRTYFGS